jgi:large subunit ribosomal protein L33
VLWPGFALWLLATDYWLLIVMAKENREMVWLQCSECGNLNYRTQIKIAGGPQKVELKKYCRRERAHRLHKVKRK